MQKKTIFTNLPTLFFYGPLQETNNLFLKEICGITWKKSTADFEKRY